MSDVVLVSLTPDSAVEVGRWRGIGQGVHGLVAWADRLLLLDSGRGALMALHPASGKLDVVWQAPEGPDVHLKGLAVVDGVAFVGISPPLDGRDPADRSLHCQVAAVELGTGQLLWRRTVPTAGLLNTITAPHLSPASPYLPASTRRVGQGTVEASPQLLAALRALVSSNMPGNASSAEQVSMAGAVRTHSRRGRDRNYNRARGIVAAANRPQPSQIHDTAKEWAALHAQVAAMLPESMRHGAGLGELAQQAAMRMQVAPVLPGGLSHGVDLAETAEEASHRSQAALLLPHSVKHAFYWSQQLSGHPPKVNGHWPSGLPQLDLLAKTEEAPWEAGLQLPLAQINMTPYKEALEKLPPGIWTDQEQARSNVLLRGRRANLEEYKPGVSTIMLIFSDQSGEATYEFPYYSEFKPLVEPLLRAVLGEGMQEHVVRLQLARMGPGATIRTHRDVGGYAMVCFPVLGNYATKSSEVLPDHECMARLDAHRIHIPISVPAGAVFQSCPTLDLHQYQLSLSGQLEDPLVARRFMAASEHGLGCTAIPLWEGLVFELNNRVLHRVVNQNTEEARVHLVVDVSEEAVKFRGKLRAGQACDYVAGGVIVCAS